MFILASLSRKLVVMSVWVVVPVKPLNRAKSRLADVLSPEQRQHFAESMLRRVLTVTRAVRAVTGTLVISRDPKALSIARDLGARTVQESGAPALNPALMRATQLLAGWRSRAVVVLPADLPFITADDVAGVIKAAGDAEQVVVIATDRARDGTNALFVRPPGLLTYDYGSHSYERHIRQAREIGAAVVEYESDNLKFDLDEPQDIVDFYRRMLGGPLPRGMTLMEGFDVIQTALDRRVAE
jgi:2-phospho-L-lactate/phosphoenolpyruvate guanylyltransferase